MRDQDHAHSPSVAGRLYALFRESKLILLPGLADAVYLAGVALTLFAAELAWLSLVGCLGIAVNAVASYRSFLSGQGEFPFWWFLPSLLLPWTAFYAMKKGAWTGRDTSSEGQQDRFRASATTFGAVIALFLVLAGLFAPVGKQIDQALAPLERPGQSYLIRTAKQVGIAFATARLLNATLSMIEDAEISAKLGVGGSVSPGEILEPLDDLVERFSEIMLLNFVTLNSLLLLGEIGKLIGLVLLAPLGIALLCIALWQAPERRGAVLRTGSRMLVLGLILRLLVPAIGAGSIVLNKLILEKKQAEAVERMPPFIREKTGEQNLVRSGGQEGAFQGQGEKASEEGIFFGFFRLGSEITDRIGEMREDIAKMREAVPRIVDSIVQQIVVFVLKSIVLPLLFLLLLIRLYRWLTSDSRAAAAMERRLREFWKGENRRSQGSPAAPSREDPPLAP